jgi:tyrosyl-tRNA synthetase
MLPVGIEIAELLVQAKLCQSKTQARKAIQQGSVKIGGEKVTDPYARLALRENRYILLESET